MTDEPHSDDARFVRRALIVIALAAAALLLWQLRFVIVLLFGAVLIATMFRAIADPLHRYLRLPSRLAVMASVILVVAIAAAVIWSIGSQVAAQGQALADTLPRAAQLVDDRLAGVGLGHPLQQWLSGSNAAAGLIGSDLKGFLSSAGLTLASFLIVFFGGIFLAAQPRLYGIGTIKLVARSQALAGRRGDGGVRSRAPPVAQGTAVGDGADLSDDLGRAVVAGGAVRPRSRADFRGARVHSLCRRDRFARFRRSWSRWW